QRTGLARTPVYRVACIARLLELLYERSLVRASFLNRIRPLHIPSGRNSTVVVVRVRDVADQLAKRAHIWRWPVVVLVGRHQVSGFRHPTAHLAEAPAQRRCRVVSAGLWRGRCCAVNLRELDIKLLVVESCGSCDSALG